MTTLPAGGPRATCRCGQVIEQCRDGCHFGGWFHPDRLTALPPERANNAHYCDNEATMLAKPALPERLTQEPGTGSDLTAAQRADRMQHWDDKISDDDVEELRGEQ